MNEIHEKIFKNLVIQTKYIGDLKSILEDHRKKYGNSNIEYLATLCFNYGIAIGKRQERAKRKKRGIE